MTTRWLWPGFIATNIAVLGVLAWASAKVMELERNETRALADARNEKRFRVAMREVEQDVLLFLEREQTRPPRSYRPFAELPRRAYAKRDLQQIEQDEILAQSELLGEDKPAFTLLHFETNRDGEVVSPQVPGANYYEICGIAPATIEKNKTHLARVRQMVDVRELARQVARETAWRNARGDQRAGKKMKGADNVDATIGPLQPVLHDGELFFMREIRHAGRYFQGFLIDWPSLRAHLLGLIHPRFPGARLRLVADDAARNLVSLPATLTVVRPPVGRRGWTASHTVLLTTWLVVGFALAVAGAALHRALTFGQKQRRFASNVTHELRSPLTTFRLYSELLAAGLVPDDEKKAEYHATLHRESGRMAQMVENVIAHARLEEGRAHMQPRPIAIGALLEDCRPDLERRAGVHPLTIETDAVKDIAVLADPAAVGQILVNLIENAAKYAPGPITLRAQVHHRTARLHVRDQGPGIQPDEARRIFQPFDRGHKDETDPVRGLGLGLALARGLAHDLGGDLTLEHPDAGGACFVLTLPLAG